MKIKFLMLKCVHYIIIILRFCFYNFMHKSETNNHTLVLLFVMLRNISSQKLIYNFTGSTNKPAFFILVVLLWIPINLLFFPWVVVIV